MNNNSYLKDLIASGKSFILDTKTPRQIQSPTKKSEKKGFQNPAAGSMTAETDPHKVFISRVINQKMKAKDIVCEIQRMCDSADALL